MRRDYFDVTYTFQKMRLPGARTDTQSLQPMGHVSVLFPWSEREHRHRSNQYLIDGKDVPYEIYFKKSWDQVNPQMK